MANTSGSTAPAWLSEGSDTHGGAVPESSPYSTPHAPWQEPVANLMAAQAWDKYGSTTVVENEMEIPSKIKMAIRVSHIIASFFLGLAATLSLLTSESFKSMVVSEMPFSISWCCTITFFHVMNR